MEKTKIPSKSHVTQTIGFQDIAIYMSHLRSEDGEYVASQQSRDYIQASDMDKPDVLEQHKEMFFSTFMIWELEHCMNTTLSVSPDVLEFIENFVENDASAEDQWGSSEDDSQLEG